MQSVLIRKSDNFLLLYPHGEKNLFQIQVSSLCPHFYVTQLHLNVKQNNNNNKKRKKNINKENESDKNESLLYLDR